MRLVWPLTRTSSVPSSPKDAVASSTALVGVYDTQAALNPAAVALVPKAVPGYTSLNLMLNRSFGERWSAQLNMNNLGNAFFIDQPQPNHLVPGEARNAQFGIKYNFKR